MAKAKHPIDERVTDDKVTGAGEKLGVEDLGPQRPHVVIRPPAQPEASNEIDFTPQQLAAAQAILGSLNTDLHARDAKGKVLPTLAERIAAQGYEVAMHGEQEAARRKGRKK